MFSGPCHHLQCTSNDINWNKTGSSALGVLHTVMVCIMLIRKSVCFDG